MRHEHPNTLLKTPEAILIINLLEQASYIIDDNTEDYFTEHQEGLYMKGHVSPLIAIGNKYYPKAHYGDDNYLVTHLNALQQEDDIVDSKDKIVLSAFNIKNRPHLFTTDPQLPISAMNVCYSILIDYLFRYCRYARGLKVRHISNYIKEQYNEVMYENYFENRLSEVLDELHDFVKKHDWNIYFHELRGTTLIIERHVDYRIYSWTETKYLEQENEERDESEDLYYS